MEERKDNRSKGERMGSRAQRGMAVSSTVVEKKAQNVGVDDLLCDGQ